MIRIIIALVLINIGSVTQAQTKGFVSHQKDFTVTSPLVSGYKFFGFEKPDEHSKKLIIFSRFIGDNQNNYADLPLGAYIETANLKPGNRIVYESTEGDFAKLNFISPDNKPIIFYVHRRYIEMAP